MMLSKTFLSRFVKLIVDAEWARLIRPACAPMLIGLCVVLVVSSGCVSKARARLEAREAYIAGQQQAMAAAQKQQSQQPQQQQQQQAGPSVNIVGEVKNTVIPWSEGLTLTRAIVAAEYLGRKDPSVIIIIRGGETTQISPKELLNGEDYTLEAGDVVQFRP